MADVVLLESFVGSGSESGHVRARSLELGKRRDYVVIIEIIVEAEVLPIVDPVIDLHRKLVAAFGLHRGGHECTVIVGRSRHILKQVDRSRIQAAEWDDVVREKVGISLGVRYVGCRPQCRRAVGPLVQRKGIGQCASER